MFLDSINVYTSARGLANTKGTGGVLSEHPNLREGGAKKVNKGLRREAELGKTRRRRKTIRLLRDRRGPLCLPLFAKALAKNH